MAARGRRCLTCDGAVPRDGRPQPCMHACMRSTTRRDVEQGGRVQGRGRALRLKHQVQAAVVQDAQVDDLQGGCRRARERCGGRGGVQSRAKPRARRCPMGPHALNRPLSTARCQPPAFNRPLSTALSTAPPHLLALEVVRGDAAQPLLADGPRQVHLRRRRGGVGSSSAAAAGGWGRGRPAGDARLAAVQGCGAPGRSACTSGAPGRTSGGLRGGAGCQQADAAAFGSGGESAASRWSLSEGTHRPRLHHPAHRVAETTGCWLGCSGVPWAGQGGSGRPRRPAGAGGRRGRPASLRGGGACWSCGTAGELALGDDELEETMPSRRPRSRRCAPLPPSADP